MGIQRNELVNHARCATADADVMDVELDGDVLYGRGSADMKGGIVAAVEALWPKPLMAEQTDRDRTLAWRFSGRWWQRDRFSKSDRPWS